MREAYRTKRPPSWLARESIAKLLIPLFFCLGALVLYTSLYQARLLPRFIAVWGLAAVALVLAFNLFSLTFEFDLSVALIFAPPIIVNEIFMGIRLIVRGFNVSTAAPKPAGGKVPLASGGTRPMFFTSKRSRSRLHARMKP